MHIHTLEKWQHSHDYAVKNEKGEQRTQYVLVLTAIVMVIEIVAGSLSGSMALLADGWHMGTHVAAFMITIVAYRYARRFAASPVYAFGTGKVTVLGGFASAVALAVVALVMLIESLERLIDPQVIHFNEAIAVAVVGLLVNIISAFLLKDDHSHHHHHDDHHHHDHDHHDHDEHDQDHNLQAAYLHVLADAMTSVFAITALVAGKYLGWGWLDPVMGVVGAVIITRWSYGLLKQTSPILLDASIDQPYQADIKAAIESDADNRVADMHIWKVGANHYAAIISVVTHFPNTTEHYKELLKPFDKLSHVTVEVHECRSEPCIAPKTKGIEA
ncbi:MAG: CDF family Co(II)/Ni(II) efflux transporter DmeF [Anaerolineae bacterium]|nr:CDF family Co(II)/Ni(II) efflux transporter DmeF [Anaerolineae bacterium]